ncbi:MAG: enoyl-CoA hydratase/isomerase family protein [Halobacteriales archaeon]
MDATDEDRIRTLTLDRPSVKNAMTPEVALDLAGAVESAGPDDVDAIVLTGAGDAFCAGGDINAMADREWPPAERARRIEESFGRLAEAMLEADVPIVGRVNGDAVGAGLALVALCDFAYASAGARFNAGFARVGLIPDTGGTFLLPALVGLRAAKRLTLAADFVDAAEAAELGLVNEAVPPDDLDDRVEACLALLDTIPTETLGRVRQALHENLGRPYPEALRTEARLQAEAYATDAHREGVRAFLER